jgi:hypothetical protein
LKNQVGKKNAVSAVETSMVKPEGGEGETQGGNDFEELTDVKLRDKRPQPIEQCEVEDGLTKENQRGTRHQSRF